MGLAPVSIEVRRDASDPVLDEERLKDLLEDDDDSSGDRRIRCPRCAWEPGPGDRWACLCGHVWNTFDTGGRCPACDQVWYDTQCLSCGAWSPHEDWYADED